MIPIILGAAGVAISIVRLIISEDESLSGIASDSVYDLGHTITQKSNIAASKRTITLNINKLTRSCSKFKIGKSGKVKQRAKAYKGYDTMYILAKSRTASIIEDLEAYYNNKYQFDDKCQNKNAGSAAVMTASSGWYFLYIALV